MSFDGVLAAGSRYSVTANSVGDVPRNPSMLKPHTFQSLVKRSFPLITLPTKRSITSGSTANLATPWVLTRLWCS